MKKIFLFIPTILAVCTLFLSGSIVHAQTTPNPNTVTQTPNVVTPNPSVVTPNPDVTTDGPGLKNPLRVDDIASLIDIIMGYIVSIGTIFLTLMLIYTGYKFIAARGNEEKITGARTALLWTVVGGLILLGARVIASAIANTVQNL